MPTWQWLFHLQQYPLESSQQFILILIFLVYNFKKNRDIFFGDNANILPENTIRNACWIGQQQENFLMKDLILQLFASPDGLSALEGAVAMERKIKWHLKHHFSAVSSLLLDYCISVVVNSQFLLQHSRCLAQRRISKCCYHKHILEERFQKEQSLDFSISLIQVL